MLRRISMGRFFGIFGISMGALFAIFGISMGAIFVIFGSSMGLLFDLWAAHPYPLLVEAAPPPVLDERLCLWLVSVGLITPRIPGSIPGWVICVSL